jgi:tRNA U34 5-methylaminomethyl-2-thiouridine-forming methyltransferase MnmC
MSEAEKKLTREEFIAKSLREAEQAEAKKGKTLSDKDTEGVKESADREYSVAEKQAEFDEINKKREGKGTRLHVGLTRGKNPQIIVWEAFDESQPTTLPTSFAEFLALTKLDEATAEVQEATTVSYLIDGYNLAMQTQASDPVAEFVEASWPDETKKQFRLAVKNQAAMLGMSIEDVANQIKPALVAALAKQSAKA